jgi:hypothetical protein
MMKKALEKVKWQLKQHELQFQPYYAGSIANDNETIETEARLIFVALASAICLSGIMICNFNELLSFYVIVNFVFVGAFIAVIEFLSCS